MTRHELKQAIFDMLRADKERQWDTRVVETNAIMALVDTYSVGVVREVAAVYLEAVQARAAEIEQELKDAHV